MSEKKEGYIHATMGKVKADGTVAELGIISGYIIESIFETQTELNGIDPKELNDMYAGYLIWVIGHFVNINDAMKKADEYDQIYKEIKEEIEN